MSIEVMSLVWKNFQRGGSEKLALLALADWCDDKGERLYPSISAIAEKINVSECQARRIVHKFIDEGILRVISNEHGGAPGSTRHYALNISALVNATRETGSAHATPSVGATPSTHATPEQGRRVASMRETASTHATLYVKEQPLRASDKEKDAPPIGSDPVVDPPKPPKAKPPAIQLDYSAWPTMPSAQVMADWVAARKAKRAPISQTVINQFGNELHKAAALGYSVDQCLAECMTSGWQGFKAAWIANRNNTGGTHGKSGRSDRESVSARAVREAAEFLADLDAAERLERDQADGSSGIHENELSLPWEGVGRL